MVATNWDTDHMEKDELLTKIVAHRLDLRPNVDLKAYSLPSNKAIHSGWRVEYALEEGCWESCSGPYLGRGESAVESVVAEVRLQMSRSAQIHQLYIFKDLYSEIRAYVMANKRVGGGDND